MDNIEFALKIEKDGKTFLFSQDVTQEIFPLSSLKVIRNINDDRVNDTPEREIYGCIIQSADDPDISLLSKGEKYTIFSVVPFRQAKNSSNSERKIRCVEDSLEDYGDFTICRPIFDMYLTNYKANNYGQYKWFLEFEEV